MTFLSQISTKIKDNHWPPLGASLAGILALWMIYLNNGRINPDGILYLEVARLFTECAWKQGLALYPWPFYSMLIASIHQITQLDFQISAYVLTVPFFALTSYSLLALVRLVGGGHKVMTATLLLLFASSYLIRDMLPLIIREHGFWAFHLLSVLFFVRYYTSKKMIHACLWGGFALTATLFRIEGLAFQIFLPFVLLFELDQPRASRVKNLIIAHAILCILIMMLLLVFTIVPGLRLDDLGRLGEPIDVVFKARDQINLILHERSRIMVDTVFNNNLADYATTGILLTLIAALIGQIGGAIGWLQTALAGFAIFSSKFISMKEKSKLVLAWWAGLGLMICICILLSGFALPGRVTIPLGFVILVAGAFGLTHLYEKWQVQKQKTGSWSWWCIAACCIIFVDLVLVLIPPDSRINYEKDGIAWAQKNIPANAKVFYEDARLRFYAGLPFSDRESGWYRLKVTGGSIDDFDFVIAHINRKHPDELGKLMNMHHFQLLKKYVDTAGNQLVILQKNR